MGMAYGYCRASTAGQQYTLEAQRLAIERHFENHLKDAGLEWGGFFEDRATSGGKPLAQREKGGELWALVEPGDCIVWSVIRRAKTGHASAPKTGHRVGGIGRKNPLVRTLLQGAAFSL